MSILNRKGQGLTEYIILVALIAVASLGVVELLGTTVRYKTAQATAKLQGKAASTIGDPEEVKDNLYKKRNLSDFWKANEANGN
jgi:Flp pilus assembly pilin Flp